jgi:predicted GIY-YIG superfamily endonuclease
MHTQQLTLALPDIGEPVARINVSLPEGVAAVDHAGRATTWPIRPDDPGTWDSIKPCATGHHLLYRFFDADGSPLYIGITWTPRERWRNHRKRKTWWHLVAAAVVECHESEHEALRRELAAIKTESPMHNKRGVSCGA